MLEELIRQNKRLCESREPIAVREILLCHTGEQKQSTSRTAISESVGGKTLYTAKISDYSKFNQNRRLYPKQLWERIIPILKQRMSEGKVKGAVDHLGEVEGGNLERSPVIWRDCYMDDTGGVYGKYEIVEGHSKGADLKALKDGGSPLGWSTFGYGNGAPPTPDQCEEYGVPEGDESYVVMHPEQYTMQILADLFLGRVKIMFHDATSW